MADKEIGMGVVYTKDSSGRKLREINGGERDLLLENLNDPYHKVITEDIIIKILVDYFCIKKIFKYKF